MSDLLRSKHLLAFFLLVSSLLTVLPPTSAAPPPWVPSTWTVLIDFSQGTDTPVYSVSRTPANGSCPAWTDPTSLHICAGDTLLWMSKTPPGRKNQLRIYLHHPFLDDSSGNPVRRLESNSGVAVGGVTSQKIHEDPFEDYSYSIAVHDGTKLYIHEPKIIIGTGANQEAKDELNELKLYAKELREFYEKNQAEKNNKDNVEELRKIIRLLQSSLPSGNN